jgi:outer membrane protein assembly factor BamB
MKTIRWLALLPLVGALGADWPQLLGPGRNGVSAEEGLVDGWPAKGPPVVWRRAAGEGYASPVVAAGRLILFHRLGDADTVECLDAATGERRWKFAYPTRYEDAYGKGNGPRSTPVIALGKVYTLGADGHLHCLDLKTGKKVWERKLLDEYTVKPSFFGVGTTPIVEGKLLLVNVGGEGAGVVAFDAETGKERWKVTDQEASYASPIAATVGGERRVFFFTREGLLVVDPAAGKVRFFKRWRSRFSASVNAASPVLLGGDRLFLSACYGTGAVLLKREKDVFEEVWKNDTSLSCHFGTPVAVGEQLYGFHGRQEEGASLRCIDWKTGRVRWTEAGYGCGSILACGKKLIVLSEGGELALVSANPEKYDERARASVLGRPCRANLALAGGLLYARDGKELVCLKVKK